MGINQIGKRAIFLDRDGVLNRNIFNPQSQAFESPLNPADVEILPGVVNALLELQRAGYLLILVSNQPNYAKGKASLETLEAIHNRVVAPLEAAGISLTAVHYCMHHPLGIVPEYSGSCVCRKPSPYFLLEDAGTYSLDLTRCWMVGDRDTDIACGRAAGTQTIRIRGNDVRDLGPGPDFEAEDLHSAATIILALE